MNESITQPLPAPPSPQTSNIFVDRPCLKCGYNLRGQTATWNRRALNWQVACPECGGMQVVLLGSAERSMPPPTAMIALAVVGVYAVWQLLAWIATSTALMIGPPDATLMHAIAPGGPLLNGYTGVLLLDNNAATIATYFLLRGVPLMLASALLGMILAISPRARASDRNFLLLLLVMLAVVYGVYLNMSGTLPKFSDISAATSKWKLLAGTIALLLSIAAGRAGLSLGRPLAKMVARMYVEPKE